jgi:hypothetical protein
MKIDLDLSVDLNAQALLRLLKLELDSVLDDKENGTESSGIYTWTWAWYNCRERGVSLAIQANFGKRALIFVFGECAAFEQVFVARATVDKFNFLDVPHFSQRWYAKAHENRTLHKVEDIGNVAKSIAKDVSGFLVAERAEAERRVADMVAAREGRL